MSLKRLIAILLWLLAVFGGQMALLFLRMCLWGTLETADLVVTQILSVAAIECMAMLQKRGDDE